MWRQYYQSVWIGLHRKFGVRASGGIGFRENIKRVTQQDATDPSSRLDFYIMYRWPAILRIPDNTLAATSCAAAARADVGVALVVRPAQ